MSHQQTGQRVGRPHRGRHTALGDDQTVPRAERGRDLRPHISRRGVERKTRGDDYGVEVTGYPAGWSVVAARTAITAAIGSGHRAAGTRRRPAGRYTGLRSRHPSPPASLHRPLPLPGGDQWPTMSRNWAV
ncbi:hypothetical protein E4099_26615 [Streptomyces palmae]|uniref:Uncharacterized protein n=1 Tax=Streptomyces palmae TaxID=1701085 RepID=A0A4Z0GC34_9ACTN|nr:hypothetical protein E4099_26615 [Streptomyces palmae]